MVSPFAVSGGPHWLTYVGIAPVIAIAGAWPRARGLHRRLLAVTAGLALFALALHAGIPVMRLLGNLPGIRAVRQDYWAVLAAGAETIAIAVAIGVIAKRGASRAAMGVAGGLLVIWLFGTAVGSAIIGNGGLTLLVLVATALVVGTVVLLARSTDRTRRRTVVLLTVGLLALELLAYQNHARLERFEPDAPTPAYIAYLREHLGGDRVLNAGRGALYPEWGAALGIPQIETFNVAQVPEYREFFQRYIVPQHGLFLEVGAQTARRYKVRQTALDLLSVRYIVTDGTMSQFERGVRERFPLVFTDAESGVSIYENPTPFPRAYLSPALADGSGPPFSPLLTRSDDDALLATADGFGIPSSAPAGAASRAARIADDDNTEVRVEVDAPRPSVLVLTDSYAPGWQVSVNGHREHLARVNDTVRGVVVPTGKSVVVFTYQSPARARGAVISLLTLAGLLVYAVVVVRRRRRATGAGY